MVTAVGPLDHNPAGPSTSWGWRTVWEGPGSVGATAGLQHPSLEGPERRQRRAVLHACPSCSLPRAPLCAVFGLNLNRLKWYVQV